MEGDRLLNDSKVVADTLNTYYTTVADDIGPASSVTEAANGVRDPNPNGINLQFHQVTPAAVHSKLVNLNTKKATGADRIPPKLLVVALMSWQPPCVRLSTSLSPKGLSLTR